MTPPNEQCDHAEAQKPPLRARPERLRHGSAAGRGCMGRFPLPLEPETWLRAESFCWSRASNVGRPTARQTCGLASRPRRSRHLQHQPGEPPGERVPGPEFSARFNNWMRRLKNDLLATKAFMGPRRTVERQLGQMLSVADAGIVLGGCHGAAGGFRFLSEFSAIPPGLAWRYLIKIPRDVLTSLLIAGGAAERTRLYFGAPRRADRTGVDHRLHGNGPKVDRAAARS